jgi:hypothetical protein
MAVTRARSQGDRANHGSDCDSQMPGDSHTHKEPILVSGLFSRPTVAPMDICPIQTLPTLARASRRFEFDPLSEADLFDFHACRFVPPHYGVCMSRVRPQPENGHGFRSRLRPGDTALGKADVEGIEQWIDRAREAAGSKAFIKAPNRRAW